MNNTDTDDPPPYDQGFEDWLAFGDAANAFTEGDTGFADYERGKATAKKRYGSR